MRHTATAICFGLGLSLLPGLVRPSLAGTALADLAGQMPPGTWTELATSNQVQALQANGASGAIFGYSEDGAWDPGSQQWLYLGGDHAYVTQGGDPPRFVRYSAATNAWQILPQPDWIGDQPMHGYDHNAINPAAGDLYHYQFGGTVYRYRIPTQTWSELPALPGPIYRSCCTGVEYFPELGGLFVANLQGESALLFKESTQQWEVLSDELPAHGYHTFAEYNPVHKLMFFGGGNDPGSRQIFKLDAAGQITPLQDAPIGLGINQSIVTVDPVSGDYLVFGEDGEFYAYDILTDTWQAQSGPVPIFEPVRGTSKVWHTNATPVGTHGVVMFVKFYFGDPSRAWVYLYKHAASTPEPPADADFASRCSDPNVVRCYGFDDPVDLAPRMYDPSGGPQQCTNSRCWQVDSGLKASGPGSLRFEIPSNTPADTSGSFWLNFRDDLSVQFGQNQQFYIQWRQRFSPEFLTTDYQGGGGWKQAIIGTGDQPGQPYYSCSDLEVVTVNGYHRGFVQMYNSCSGSASHGPFDGFEEPYGAYDFKLQNGRPAPFCLYSQGRTDPATYFPPEGNCFGYFPDEWMTFQVGIQTGPRVGDEFTNSRVRLWIAREGQPSELVIDWGPYNLTAGAPGENQRFGKIWFLPYNTGKDSSQSHPTAYTWHDELIISRARIPDPGAPPPPAAGAWPGSGLGPGLLAALTLTFGLLRFRVHARARRSHVKNQTRRRLDRCLT
jgi:hypothetical protein